MSGKALRRERLGPIYAIADADSLGETPLPEAVKAMAGAGIRTIQVRAKRLSGAELYRAVEGCVAALDGLGSDTVDLWIDDRADLAALLPVAGVHVGQRDLPPGAVRRVLGDGGWIGLSTHGEAQIEEADGDPAVDLVAVGPIFPTASKERPDPVVGLDFLHRARLLTEKPLVAIGGIGPEQVGPVLAAGADAAVVLSAVCRGGLGSIAASCRRLVACASS